MPIALGIYDFFSYIVPGVLYILVVNEALRVFGLPSVNVSQFDANFGSALFWLILAYGIGQVMDTFGIKWYTLFNKFNAEIKAMSDFKRRNADLEIGFNLDDRKILFSIVRHHKPELALFIDNFKAISIMLNNISLGLFLLGIVQLISLIIGGFSMLALLTSLGAFGLSYVAVRRSMLFNEWHWTAVFEHARQFGRTVAEMYGMGEKAEGTISVPAPPSLVSKKKHPVKPVDSDKHKARLN